jgi:hypothetical protein
MCRAPVVHDGMAIVGYVVGGTLFTFFKIDSTLQEVRNRYMFIPIWPGLRMDQSQSMQEFMH